MAAKPDLISTAKLPDTCWARLQERFAVHMLPPDGAERVYESGPVDMRSEDVAGPG